MADKEIPLKASEVIDLMKKQYPKGVTPPNGILDALIEAQKSEVLAENEASKKESSF